MLGFFSPKFFFFTNIECLNLKLLNTFQFKINLQNLKRDQFQNLENSIFSILMDFNFKHKTLLLNYRGF